MSDFHEGARQGFPSDTCPVCNHAGPLAYDFKKFGQHSLRVCPECKAVCVDGKQVAVIEVKEGA